MVALQHRPQVVWGFQTMICFPAVTLGLILEEETNRSTCPDELNKTDRSYWFNREENLRLNHCLDFDNFEHQLKSGIFTCVSQLNC